MTLRRRWNEVPIQPEGMPQGVPCGRISQEEGQLAISHFSVAFYRSNAGASDDLARRLLDRRTLGTRASAAAVRPVWLYVRAGEHGMERL